MKEINTKKMIALAIIGAICILAITQGVVAAVNGDYDQIVNSSVLTMGSTITGFYFGVGSQKQSDEGNNK